LCDYLVVKVAEPMTCLMSEYIGFCQQTLDYVLRAASIDSLPRPVKVSPALHGSIASRLILA